MCLGSSLKEGVLRFDFASTSRHYGVLLEGLTTTLWLAGLSAVLVLLVGGAIAVVQLGGHRKVNALLAAYVELMRNTPLLVTLYLIYFGLPLTGILLSTFASILLALVMQHSVFVAEILRGGFLSVPRAQIAAGKALGMSWPQIFRIVLLPQALATAIPGLSGAMILLLQDTSLAAAISLVDLTMAAKVISQRTATSFEPFIVIAAMYLALSVCLAQLGRVIEARFSFAR
jgi:His/Glu/Gln/Arg/opine family amino acid ABC transporter permease subunit